LTYCAKKGTIIIKASELNSAKYTDNFFLNAPVVNYYLETLLFNITGLKTVMKSALRALLRVKLDPEKNTQAFRN
jgi:hypothetical protein